MRELPDDRAGASSSATLSINRSGEITLRIPALALVLVLVLSGCSDLRAPVEPTADSSPSKTALPTVSVETTCDLLFSRDLKSGPLPQATDLILKFAAAPDGSTIAVEEVDSILEDLDAALRTADSSLVPYIEAQRSPIADLSEVLHGGENRNLDLQDFQASGLELLNRCT